MKSKMKTPRALEHRVFPNEPEATRAALKFFRRSPRAQGPLWLRSTLIGRLERKTLYYREGASVVRSVALVQEVTP